MKNHVLIVGAGIVGASSALALAEQGFKVSVADKSSALGMGASGLNGAQLSYNYTDALASPELLRIMPEMLLGLNAAFRLRPRFDIDFVRWVLQFLRNTRGARSDENTLAILQVALRSKEVLEQWQQRYDFEFNYRPAAKLHLYEDARLLDNARRRVELKNRYGANQEFVSAQQALEIEPALRHMQAKLAGAIHSPDEAVGDVQAFTRTALNRAISLGGGELMLNTPVDRFRVEKNRVSFAQTNAGEVAFDYLVLCAGYQTPLLAHRLGLKTMPICPVAGYSLTYPISSSTPETSLTDIVNRIVLCRLGDQLRVAGMADVGRVVKSPLAARIKQLETLVQARFPLAGDYQLPGRAWVGVRPVTPTSQPVVAKTLLDNVYINAGHGMLGWTLAAGTADIVSQLILRDA